MISNRRVLAFWRREPRAAIEDRRLAAVRRSIADALQSVTAELLEVATWLETLRDSAGLALGTEDGLLFEREPEDQRLLGEVEARMRATKARLAELTTLQARLGEVEALLDRSDPGETSADLFVHPGAGWTGRWAEGADASR